MFRTSMPIVTGLAGTLAMPLPAAANEPWAGLDLLWVQPASEPGAPRHCARFLVLNLPRDWMAGDAAVAIFTTEGGRSAMHPIVDALLPELPAVLEVPLHLVAECHVAPAEPAAEVLGAVDALHVTAGAGLVVAIGIGSMGPAVLAATREDVAARYLGPHGWRLAAAVALDGDAPARFALGAPAAADEWADRAPLLCDALATASRTVSPRDCRAAFGVDPPAARGTETAQARRGGRARNR